MTEWTQWHCIDATGHGRWQTRSILSPGANQVKVADIDGDGALEVVIAAIDGHVIVRRGIDGESLWDFYAGDEITCVAPASGAAPANGLAAGSYNGYLYRLDRAGVLQWYTYLEEEIRCLTRIGAGWIAGTAAGLVFSIDEHGEIVDILNLGAPVCRMVLVGSSDGERGMVAAVENGQIFAFAV